MSDTKTFEVK